jgi:hypothetical protein
VPAAAAPNMEVSVFFWCTGFSLIGHCDREGGRSTGSRDGHLSPGSQRSLDRTHGCSLTRGVAGWRLDCSRSAGRELPPLVLLRGRPARVRFRSLWCVDCDAADRRLVEDPPGCRVEATAGFAPFREVGS